MDFFLMFWLLPTFAVAALAGMALHRTYIASDQEARGWEAIITLAALGTAVVCSLTRCIAALVAPQADLSHLVANTIVFGLLSIPISGLASFIWLIRTRSPQAGFSLAASFFSLLANFMVA